MEAQPAESSSGFRWIGGVTGSLVLIALAAVVLLGRGAVSTSDRVTRPEVGSTSPARAVSIQVVGLPEGMAPKIYVVKPVSDGRGGYSIEYLIGSFTVGTVEVAPDAVIQAAPIPYGDQTRYWPANRFQPVQGSAGSMTFTFQKQYLVGVGKAYNGPVVSGFSWDQMPGEVWLKFGDTVMKDGGYVPADSQLTITATAPQGVRFLRWDIKDGQDSTSTENPLRVTLNGPIQLTAYFRGGP